MDDDQARGGAFPSDTGAGARQAPILVCRRHVVHIGGFESVEPKALGRRLAVGLESLGRIWGIKGDLGEAEIAADGMVATWPVSAAGGNWAVAVRFTVLRWDALIRPYAERGWVGRTLAGFAALLDYLATGTVGRFYRTAPRYGNFTIFPALVLVAAAILAGNAGYLAAKIAPLGGLVIALGGFVILMALADRYLRLDFCLSHWAFARDFARRRIDGLDEILDRFAREIAAAVKDGDADEVIVSATSLGTAMAVEAIARALEIDPQLAARGPSVALLTTGSSLLQIGLHPAAAALRRSVARVAAEAELLWLEVQSGADALNFYKSDPVTGMGLAPARRLTVKFVRIRHMLTARQYRRITLNHLAIHRRYVMPNGVRYHYDFYLICFGPLALRDWAGLGESAPALFGPDGSCGGRLVPEAGETRPA